MLNVLCLIIRYFQIAFTQVLSLQRFSLSLLGVHQGISGNHLYKQLLEERTALIFCHLKPNQIRSLIRILLLVQLVLTTEPEGNCISFCFVHLKLIFISFFVSYRPCFVASFHVLVRI